MNEGDLSARRIDGIVVGASAGGVEALSIILPALRAGLHATVFIVIHLSRECPSLLAEIFTPICALPVREASDKEPAQCGTIYFAPADYHLLVEAGPQLALSVDEPLHFCRPSIDVLFESAADVYGEHLLGIILTGANEDGSAGLEAIHRRGGVTIVQQPETAQVPVMVLSALKRGPVDFILPLENIADLLRTLSVDFTSRRAVAEGN